MCACLQAGNPGRYMVRCDRALLRSPPDGGSADHLTAPVEVAVSAQPKRSGRRVLSLLPFAASPALIPGRWAGRAGLPLLGPTALRRHHHQAEPLPLPRPPDGHLAGTRHLCTRHQRDDQPLSGAPASHLFGSAQVSEPDLVPAEAASVNSERTSVAGCIYSLRQAHAANVDCLPA